MAQWTISQNQNDGYPWYSNFISPVEDLYGTNANQSFWRIDKDGKINDGYPYNWAIKDFVEGAGETSGGEGTDSIDTSLYNKKQYTDPRTAGESKIPGDKTSMRGASSTTIGTALANQSNYYVTNHAGVNGLIKGLNDFGTHFSDIIESNVISKIYGGDIWDSCVLCKGYPFSIPVGVEKAGLITMGLNLTEDNTAVTYYYPESLYSKFDFGSIDLNITHAYEISRNTYQIYLPYAGIQRIPITGTETLSLEAYVEYLTGQITYVLYADEQVILTANGNCGINIPINAKQGQVAANTTTSIIQTGAAVTSAALPLVTSLVGGVMSQIPESGEMSYIPDFEHPEEIERMTYTHPRNMDNFVKTAGTGMLTAQAINGIIDASMGSPVPLSNTQFTSGLISAALYQKPRILYRIPRIYNQALGQNFVGFVYKKYVDNLSEIPTGELVKCTNYRCTSQVAVEDEKSQIVSLLQSGVIM